MILRELLDIAARTLWPTRCPHCYWRCLNAKALAIHLHVDHGDETPDEKTAARWARLGLGS